jgi:competence protein ComEC
MAVVRLAIAYLVGTSALLVLPELPQGPVVLLGVGVAAITVVRRRAWPLLAIAIGFGAAWTAARERLDDRLDPALEGRTLTVRGVVASVPQTLPNGLRFQLATRSAPGVPSLIEVTWYEPPWRPRAAERLALEVRLRRPRGFSNPGGGDAEARLLREHIGATGYVRSASSEGRDRGDVVRRPVLVARGRVHEAIRAVLGERPAAGIAAGLAVGLQDALSREQWRELARSGTSHLMAISGMHIGMLAAVAAWLAARVQRWRQRRGARGTTRDAAVLAAAVTAVGYALLAGWSVPARRTAIMIGLLALALRSRRRVGGAQALAAGALTVLALDPLAPLAVGFWLSFGAVAVILLATTGEVSRQGTVREFGRVQLAVSVGLVPMLVGGFGQISLVAPLVNLVAIPLYTLVVVPSVLLASACAVIAPEPGALALRGVAWLIESTWPVVAVPAHWPYACWGVAALPIAGWVTLVGGAIAAVAPLPAPGRVAGLLIVAATCAWCASPVAPGAVHFALLDVGQGLAVVVETRRHVLIYDTGPSFRSGTDTGLLVVEPYLRSRGRRRVDLMVASHDDNDHSGGAASLSRLLDVGALAASGHALDRLGPVQPCRAGHQWVWDDVRFDWLHPGESLLPRDNDRSCVLRVRAGPYTILLMGDAEALAEREMLGRGVVDRADLVVVAHHGSRSSSTEAFVAQTRPRWALVSAGYRNRWGFPAASIVERWRDAGAQIASTAHSGAIEFELMPREALAAPREWRVVRRRWWQDP